MPGLNATFGAGGEELFQAACAETISIPPLKCSVAGALWLRITIRRVSQSSRESHRGFLVDDLDAAIAYYRQRLGTPAALIHPVHLVGRNLTDRSIDVGIRAKGKDATARLP